MATDLAPKLCALASRHIGIDTQNLSVDPALGHGIPPK